LIARESLFIAARVGLCGFLFRGRDFSDLVASGSPGVASAVTPAAFLLPGVIAKFFSCLVYTF